MKIRFPRDILAALSAANLVLLVLLWVCETVVAERNWLTTLLTYAPQQPFALGAIVLGVWSVWRKNRPAILLNALAAIFLVFVVLGFNVPLGAGGWSGPTIRILTYNIDGSRRGGARVAEVVKAARPDIICLEEAAPILPWSDAIKEIHRILPQYQFAGCWDVAIFSRYPIMKNQWHLVQPEAGRNVQQVMVNLNGRPLTVFTYHMGTPVYGQSSAHGRSQLPNLSGGIRRGPICSDAPGPRLRRGNARPRGDRR